MKKYLNKILDSKFKVKKRATINSFLFFLIWFVILLFIADTPPPRGFVVVPIILGGLSCILYIYSLFFIPRLITNEKYLLLKSLLHWIITGVFLGFFLALIPSGEPSIQEHITVSDKLILLGIIVLLSILNGIGFYVFNLILDKSNYFQE